MNGNSKAVIFRKAIDAYNLAESHKKNGETVTEQIWRDEYNRLMKKYIGKK